VLAKRTRRPEVNRPVRDVQHPGVGVELLVLDRDARLALGQAEHGVDSRRTLALLGPPRERLPLALRPERGGPLVHRADDGLGPPLRFAAAVDGEAPSIPGEPLPPAVHVPQIRTVLAHEPSRVPEVGEVLFFFFVVVFARAWMNTMFLMNGSARIPRRARGGPLHLLCVQGRPAALRVHAAQLAEDGVLALSPAAHAGRDAEQLAVALALRDRAAAVRRARARRRDALEPLRRQLGQLGQVFG
jgi:hypothetical protein